jgi:cytochrome c
MDFFDKLVLPQSLEHNALLHFLSILVLMFFIPFLSFVFGGSIVSLFFRRKGLKENNAHATRFARQVIEITTVNKSIGVGLGIVPVLMLILTYAQLLHTLNLIAVKYFILLLPVLLTGLVLVYTYRYAFVFKGLLKNVNGNAEENADAGIYEGKLEKLFLSTGKWAVFFLAVATYLFVAGFTASLLSASSDVVLTLSSILNSATIFFRWLYFVSAALSLTGALLLFHFFYWEGGRSGEDPEYLAFVRKALLKLVFIAALAQPLLLMINTAALPLGSLSMHIFLLTFIVIVFLFVVYHLLYHCLKTGRTEHVATVFVLLLLATFALIVSDQTALGNATTKNTLVLGSVYDEYKAELEKASVNPTAASGEQIFKNKCSACHKFDQKLVGPPYKETLPKYGDDAAKLAAFVYNPVKVNPAYPSMPNQGLKPAEAKAIAKWILEQVKKY